jgi:poly(3-hydroxybutyrate) depolymerase
MVRQQLGSNIAGMKNARILLLLALGALGNGLGGCASSDTSTGSSFGANGGTDSVGAVGGSLDALAPTVTVLTNVTLAGFPHKMDVYLPSNAARVVVFLHGGGGTKEGGAAHESGIRLDDPPGATPVPNTAWLTTWRTAFVFPQGQAIATSPSATTWSNYVMTSGVDDKLFLTALANALRGGSFGGGVPSFAHVYLAGHSTGGMMTNRMWCEAPAAFDAYGSLAGPASTQLAPPSLMLSTSDPLAGTHPCVPSIARPYIGVIGEQDTILQTQGAWSQDTWAINDCLSQGGGGAMIDPALVNEQRFHALRVAAVCGGTVGAPTTSADGATITWSDCGGRVRLKGVTNADHCVSAGQVVCLGDKLLGGPCANSLEAESGTAMRDVLTSFFISTE